VKIRIVRSRVVLPLAVAALPLVLLYSSLRTFEELDLQREVYLRERISLLAGRLENLPAEATPESIRESLSEEDPNLVGLEIISRGGSGDSANLAAIWNGQELFRSELSGESGVKAYRAYVPFHSSEGLRIARIDLDPAAADFLLVHARHNVIVASLSGFTLVGLSILLFWSMRRSANLRVRQLEVEHLTHMGKMAVVLAHEIRNPLGTIKGFVQLAGERSDSAIGDLLKPALLETERLERLVKDLLAYARPASPSPVKGSGRIPRLQ
jgi:signal transduction histidine kinase